MTNDDLIALMKSRRLKQKDLADLLGISPEKVSKTLAGVRQWKAREWDIIKQWAHEGSSLIPVPLGPQLQVIGEVAAGVWKETWIFEPSERETYFGRADVSAPLIERYGLRVSGDSMDEIYPDGSIVDCVTYRHDHVIPDGKRVIVQRKKYDGTCEVTVKELARGADGVEWLRPRSSNPAHQAFRADVPDSPDIESVEIIATVVSSVRPE